MKSNYETEEKNFGHSKKLLQMNETQRVLNIVFNEINHLMNHSSIIVAFFLEHEDELKTYKIQFPEQKEKLEFSYQDITLNLSNYASLKECIQENKILDVKKSNLSDFDYYIQQRFSFWSLEHAIFFPFALSNEKPIGILAVLSFEEEIKDYIIKSIPAIIELFYYSTAEALKKEQFECAKEEIECTKAKYHYFIKLVETLNKIHNPDKFLKELINSFLDYFGFQLGFLQLEVDSKLPIVNGAAKTEDLKNILKNEIQYFGKIENAPLINGEQGPETASCNTFLNESPFYIPDASSFKEDIKITQKDKKAFELAQGKQIKSILQMPFKNEEELPLGVLQLWSFENIVFLSKTDIELIKSFSSFFLRITDILRENIKKD